QCSGASNKVSLSESQVSQLGLSSHHPACDEVATEPSVLHVRLRSTCSNQYLRPAALRGCSRRILAATNAEPDACDSAESCSRAAGNELFQLHYWTQHPSYPWRIPRSRFGRVQVVSLRQRRRTSGNDSRRFILDAQLRFPTDEIKRKGSRSETATIAEVLAPSEGGLRACSKAEINLDLPAFTLAAASAPATPSALA
uniref:Autophagy-related protein 13 n=1 Tax=Macrostomum lignano TaxID=282301 RepID=A0A1I8JGT0_9PLAT